MAQYVITRSFGPAGSTRYLYEKTAPALRKARLLERSAAEFRITDGSGAPLTMADLEVISCQDARGESSDADPTAV